MLAEDLVIVELKLCEDIVPVHQAEFLTYLKLLEKTKGVLFNFNYTTLFKEGKTLVNEY